MRQVNNEFSNDVMTVSVSRFGQSTMTLTVPVDATVSEVLTQANVSTQGNEQIFVAGISANANDILEDGDIVSVITPKQAGAK